MNCPNCNTKNSKGSNYCAQCGSELVRKKSPDITELKVKRNYKQAIVFYLLYFVIYLILGFIVGVILNAAGYEIAVSMDNTGYRIVVFSATVFSMFLGAFILDAKNRTDDFLSWIIVIVSIPLTFWGGGLLGLIPLAYLTTREPID